MFKQVLFDDFDLMLPSSLVFVTTGLINMAEIRDHAK